MEVPSRGWGRKEHILLIALILVAFVLPTDAKTYINTTCKDAKFPTVDGGDVHPLFENSTVLLHVFFITSHFRSHGVFTFFMLGNLPSVHKFLTQPQGMVIAILRPNRPAAWPHVLRRHIPLIDATIGPSIEEMAAEIEAKKKRDKPVLKDLPLSTLSPIRSIAEDCSDLTYQPCQIVDRILRAIGEGGSHFGMTHDELVQFRKGIWRYGDRTGLDRTRPTVFFWVEAPFPMIPDSAIKKVVRAAKRSEVKNKPFIWATPCDDKGDRRMDISYVLGTLLSVHWPFVAPEFGIFRHLFGYWVRLDSDVTIHKPLPVHLGRLYNVTQTKLSWMHIVGHPCSNNLMKFYDRFLNNSCLKPRSPNSLFLEKPADVVWSYFVGGPFSYWASPFMKKFATEWWEEEVPWIKYRWGDQQWWPHAVAITEPPIKSLQPSQLPPAIRELRGDSGLYTGDRLGKDDPMGLLSLKCLRKAGHWAHKFDLRGSVDSHHIWPRIPSTEESCKDLIRMCKKFNCFLDTGNATVVGLPPP